MNPFELFQQLKPQIERDDAIIRNLRSYAFDENHHLEYAEGGESNVHYRVGRIGELWLVTREFFKSIGNPEEQIQACDTYIDGLLSNHRFGREVPRIVGGVRAVGAIKKGQKELDRYILLLEDLSAGGTAIDFVPGTRGSWFGKLGGRLIYYDFPESVTFHIKYMTEGNMIRIER